MSSKNILIINGNPDPSPQRLSSAIAAAYREGAVNAGHDPRQTDVGALSLPVLRTAVEFASPPNDVGWKTDTIIEPGMTIDDVSRNM
jgi:putative NADPH-quinone reductase